MSADREPAYRLELKRDLSSAGVPWHIAIYPLSGTTAAYARYDVYRPTRDEVIAAAAGWIAACDPDTADETLYADRHGDLVPAP